MCDPAVKSVDWKIVYGGRLAKLVSLTNSLVVFFVCRILWACSPNAFVGIVLTCFFTTILLHALAALGNISGCLYSVLDRMFKTDLCYYVLTLSSFWVLKIHGTVMHGYEIRGKENLPQSTGGLVVYPHLLLPYDMLYLMSDFFFERREVLGGIIHRDLEALAPGLCRGLHFFSSKETLRKKLKEGKICSVAPGGGFEAVFSEDNELLWQGRTGFAAVAKECGVPIIPMFTVNGQEAMPVKIPFFRRFFENVYVQTRQTFFLPLLQFPVKMTVVIGEPIFCRDDESPAEFAKRAEMEIRNLRHKHQHRAGSTFLAFLERFGWRP